MDGRGDEARTREQHRFAVFGLLRRANQRQPVAHIVDLALVVQKLVLAVAQAACLRRVEEEIRVEFVVVAFA